MRDPSARGVIGPCALALLRPSRGAACRARARAHRLPPHRRRLPHRRRGVREYMRASRVPERPSARELCQASRRQSFVIDRVVHRQADVRMRSCVAHEIIHPDAEILPHTWRTARSVSASKLSSTAYPLRLASKEPPQTGFIQYRDAQLGSLVQLRTWTLADHQVIGLLGGEPRGHLPPQGLDASLRLFA